MLTNLVWKGGEKMEVLETLNRLETELAEREKHRVSEDSKVLAVFVQKTLKIAKRQAAGEVY